MFFFSLEYFTVSVSIFGEAKDTNKQENSQKNIEKWEKVQLSERNTNDIDVQHGRWVVGFEVSISK